MFSRGKKQRFSCRDWEKVCSWFSARWALAAGAGSKAMPADKYLLLGGKGLERCLDSEDTVLFC